MIVWMSSPCVALSRSMDWDGVDDLLAPAVGTANVRTSARLPAVASSAARIAAIVESGRRSSLPTARNRRPRHGSSGAGEPGELGSMADRMPEISVAERRSCRREHQRLTAEIPTSAHHSSTSSSRSAPSAYRCREDRYPSLKGVATVAVEDDAEMLRTLRPEPVATTAARRGNRGSCASLDLHASPLGPRESRKPGSSLGPYGRARRCCALLDVDGFGHGLARTWWGRVRRHPPSTALDRPAQRVLSSRI